MSGAAQRFVRSDALGVGDLDPGYARAVSTAEPAEAPPSRIPFEIALGLRLGLGPAATGLLVAAVLAAGALAFHAAVAGGLLRVEEFVSLGFATRASLIASLATGYVFFASRYGAIGSYRDARELGLLPDATPDLEASYEMPPDVAAQGRRIALLGVLFFLITLELPNWLAGIGFFGAWRSFHVLAYLQFVGVLFFWCAGRAAFLSLRGMRALGALAEAELRIDLLDLAPLSVFGRAAVRNCLLWLVSFSLGSLVFLNPEVTFRESLVVFVPVFLVNLTIAGLALWLPLRGVHERVSAAKRAELARIDAALRGDAAALRETRIAHWDHGAGLADLLAYRRYVDDVRSWPFEGPTLGRLALFVLIPIGSWVGGALVERAVEAALQ